MPKTNKMSSLQEQLTRASGRAAPAAALPAAPAVTPPQPSRAPSRHNKVHIGAYLPAGFKSSLRLVQAQTGEDTQTVLARALNELFRAHRVPEVDSE